LKWGKIGDFVDFEFGAVLPVEGADVVYNYAVDWASELGGGLVWYVRPDEYAINLRGMTAESF
jgi:hypothetical protein